MAFLILSTLLVTTVILLIGALTNTKEARQRVRTLERQYGVSHVLGEPSDSPDQESDGT